MRLRLTNWLSKPENNISFTVFALLAGFSTYFSMYAFRKPLTASTYEDLAGWDSVIDFKILAITAQVFGYALSKFIGIKYVSEALKHQRALMIIALILVSELALIMFAVLPPKGKIIAVIFNGLPLGMIWGLVFSFMEGRRVSEVLGAGLCASFIVSSGVVKSIGVALIVYLAVPDVWMPAVTGALFLPVLFVSVYGLSLLPPPNTCDIKARSARLPMTKTDRQAFFKAYAGGLLALVLAYIIFTILRDVRDNFTPEIWASLGYEDMPSVFILSELPVAFFVLALLACFMLIKNNQQAVRIYHFVIAFGAGVVLASTLALMGGIIGPFVWMVLVGAGLYTAYVPFNCILFDRLLAVLGGKANAGFMIYVADAFGYLGSFTVLLVKNFAAPSLDWADFFIGFCLFSGVAGIMFALYASYYFHRNVTAVKPRVSRI